MLKPDISLIHKALTARGEGYKRHAGNCTGPSQSLTFRFFTQEARMSPENHKTS